MNLSTNAAHAMDYSGTLSISLREQLLEKNTMPAGLLGNLKDGVNCRVFPVGDVEAAVGCLRDLRDPNLRNRLARAGRELVVGEYTRERSVERWSECFRQVGLLLGVAEVGAAVGEQDEDRVGLAPAPSTELA